MSSIYVNLTDFHPKTIDFIVPHVYRELCWLPVCLPVCLSVCLSGAVLSP
jgi:hypothetical protein